MTRIFSYTQPVDADVVDAFCTLQKGFTDQFVYYRKDQPLGFFGLGRCIAITSLDDVEIQLEGQTPQQPIFFSFNRFDADNPSPSDELFSSFPRLVLMLPEIVLIENDEGAFLQVNSLGPVYSGRVLRFAKQANAASERHAVSIPFVLEPDSLNDWISAVNKGLAAIGEGRVKKVVLSRRRRLIANQLFSSKDLLVNLIDGSAQGTVFLYRYADVFFCGCTPELLVRIRGNYLESMCLAGTCQKGRTPDEQKKHADALFNDAKNRTEHDYVVCFVRDVLERSCYGVEVPDTPQVAAFQHVQHLFTPASAHILEGVTLKDMAQDLHPTPATSGTPVGEAKMLIRAIESYNRGFFAGTCGYVDGAGDGEYSVALRCGVFDGEIGWVYAGCGIVDGSSAYDEYNEIDLKFKTILGAFG